MSEIRLAGLLERGFEVNLRLADFSFFDRTDSERGHVVVVVAFGRQSGILITHLRGQPFTIWRVW